LRVDAKTGEEEEGLHKVEKEGTGHSLMESTRNPGHILEYQQLLKLGIEELEVPKRESTSSVPRQQDGISVIGNDTWTGREGGTRWDGYESLDVWWKSSSSAAQLWWDCWCSKRVSDKIQGRKTYCHVCSLIVICMWLITCPRTSRRRGSVAGGSSSNMSS